MLDARLDPACPDARSLVKMHEDQDALLVGGSEGQLALVVRATHAKQIGDHVTLCARCGRYDPRCSECRFDPRRERHGWMCHQQAARWRDVFPWNWRARHPAAASPAPAAARRVQVETGEARRAHMAPHVTTSAAGPAAAAPRHAPSPGGGAARAKPMAPRRSPVEAAYASLGLTRAPTQEELRAAFREKAQQYHPDKVASMAPEFREVAERKMREINAAYELLKEQASARK